METFDKRQDYIEFYSTNDITMRRVVRFFFRLFMKYLNPTAILLTLKFNAFEVASSDFESNFLFQLPFQTIGHVKTFSSV